MTKTESHLALSNESLSKPHQHLFVIDFDIGCAWTRTLLELLALLVLVAPCRLVHHLHRVVQRVVFFFHTITV